jgi:hypothetical protein
VIGQCIKMASLYLLTQKFWYLRLQYFEMML